MNLFYGNDIYIQKLTKSTELQLTK